MVKIQKKRFRRAITPIIATILILALVVAGVVIGFVQIVPYIERSKVETDAASIQSSLIKVDNAIWDMIADSAGSYLADSVPSRRLQVTISIGTLGVSDSSNNFTYQPFMCSGPCGAFNVNSFDLTDSNSSTGTYGILSHTFTSTYTLLPANSLEYLTGSNPYQKRSLISYNSISSSISDEQSSTNISMYRVGYDHYIDLSYRPKIFFSQSVDNGIINNNINIYLIKLTGTTSFVGTTNMFLKYTGSTVQKLIYPASSGQYFDMAFLADNNINQLSIMADNTFPAAPGGFTTNFVVTTTTQTFSISG